MNKGIYTKLTKRLFLLQGMRNEIDQAEYERQREDSIPVGEGVIGSRMYFRVDSETSNPTPVPSSLVKNWDTDTEITELLDLNREQVQPEGWFQWIKLKLKTICFCQPIRLVLATILLWLSIGLIHTKCVLCFVL